MQWLANRQYGDFIWRPSWNTKHSEKHSLLMHNMPFDMYFVDSSCGPHIDKCKPYDFRWFGKIHENELRQKADQLIAEYSRSASLYPHNTFLAIVGGDFRYEVDYEFDSQYNYKMIIDYVNSNSARYNNTKLQFGTPKDYFKIVKERTQEFPSLVGDLLPYGDVFTDGQPAYWTGYFTTVFNFKLFLLSNIIIQVFSEEDETILTAICSCVYLCFKIFIQSHKFLKISFSKNERKMSGSSDYKDFFDIIVILDRTLLSFSAGNFLSLENVLSIFNRPVKMVIFHYT